MERGASKAEQQKLLRQTLAAVRPDPRATPELERYFSQIREALGMATIEVELADSTQRAAYLDFTVTVIAWALVGFVSGNPDVFQEIAEEWVERFEKRSAKMLKDTQAALRATEHLERLIRK